jgi:phosphonatase-like hydrolase
VEIENCELIAFDVAGTTVNDDGVVLRAFERAFEESQPENWQERRIQWLEYANETMGRSKIEVFTDLLGDHEKARRATTLFEAAYLAEVVKGEVKAIPGTEQLFHELHDAGIAVGLTTGFSRRILDAIIESLDWSALIDSSSTPEEAGRGRPSPAMLEHLARQASLSSPNRSIVIGDTQADMEAGVAFGAGQVIGVRTGAHREAKLIAAGATRIINSVADLN